MIGSERATSCCFNQLRASFNSDKADHFAILLSDKRFQSAPRFIHFRLQAAFWPENSRGRRSFNQLRASFISDNAMFENYGSSSYVSISSALHSFPTYLGDNDGYELCQSFNQLRASFISDRCVRRVTADVKKGFQSAPRFIHFRHPVALPAVLGGYVFQSAPRFIHFRPKKSRCTSTASGRFNQLRASFISDRGPCKSLSDNNFQCLLRGSAPFGHSRTMLPVFSCAVTIVTLCQISIYRNARLNYTQVCVSPYH